MIPDLRGLLRVRTKEGSFFQRYLLDFMNCEPSLQVSNPSAFRMSG